MIAALDADVVWDTDLGNRVNDALLARDDIATRTHGAVTVARMNEDLEDVLQRVPGVREEGRLADWEEMLFAGDDSGAVHIFSISSPDPIQEAAPRATSELTLGEVYTELGSSENDPTPSTQIFTLLGPDDEEEDYAITYEGELIAGP